MRPALSTRLALWAQAHPWRAVGVLTVLTGLASSALLLAWYVEWSGALGDVVLMTLVHVPEGVMLGAAACLLVVALRRRRLDVSGTAWLAIAVALPIVWLLPSALWAFYGPYGAAVSWTSPETIWTIGFASARAVGFVAVLFAALWMVPQRGAARRLVALSAWTTATAALGLLVTLVANQTLPDANAIGDATAVGGTFVVALWLGIWVRCAGPDVAELCLWALLAVLVCWPLEVGVREFALSAPLIELLDGPLYHFAALYDVWGRLLGVVLLAPLVRALDRVTLIPDDHPVHDGRVAPTNDA